MADQLRQQILDLLALEPQTEAIVRQVAFLKDELLKDELKRKRQQIFDLLAEPQTETIVRRVAFLKDELKTQQQGKSIIICASFM